MFVSTISFRGASVLTSTTTLSAAATRTAFSGQEYAILYLLRITEDGSQRSTENGDLRIAHDPIDLLRITEDGSQRVIESGDIRVAHDPTNHPNLNDWQLSTTSVKYAGTWYDTPRGYVHNGGIWKRIL
jgi:hypothetical protein